MKNESFSMSRHKKFNSVGKDLTDEINKGKTYKTNRKITSIAIHCSFSPQNRGDTVHTIDNWHSDRWGSGIGYHYVVDEQGRIFKGRWLDYPGAHVKGWNDNSIGICRIGGMDDARNSTLDTTPSQYKSIQKLVKLLISDDMYGLLPSDIKGHNEYPNVNKACPLMDMNKIRELV